MRMRWMKVMGCIGILVFIPGISLCAAQGDATPLMGRDYFPGVHRALQEAKESIYVVMHIMEIGVGIENNPAEVLVQDLIDAHQRGVKVKVILDKNLPEVDEELDDYERVGEKNDKAHELLKSKGVDVTFDSPEVVTGACAVVIDGHIAIVGSTFWDYQGLAENIEVSMMVESEKIAEEYMDFIRGVEAKIAEYEEKL